MSYLAPPDPAQVELLRRTCVAYPWASECRGMAPVVPTDAENAGLWSGPGGYQELYGAMKKDIPLGTQCEPVQLIPLNAIGKRLHDPPLGQPSNSMYMQIRQMNPVVGAAVAAQLEKLINDFL